MITRSQKVRLGIFISVASAIFISTILILSMNQFLKKRDVYYISYKNISVIGLNVGSSVKYLGINMGTVQNISIDPEDVNSIIVSIGLNEGTPIKADVRADISSIGITGLKTIELRGGSNAAKLLKPESHIKPGTSLTEDITGKAEIIAEKIELVLNNIIRLTADSNQDKLMVLLEDASNAVTQLNGILNTSKPKIDRSLRNFDNSMFELSAASSSANYTLSKIEEFVASDSLEATLRNISQISEKLNNANIYTLDQEINLAVNKFNDLLYRMDLLVKYNINKFNLTMDNLNETSRYLNNAARQIDENP